MKCHAPSDRIASSRLSDSASNGARATPRLVTRARRERTQAYQYSRVSPEGVGPKLYYGGSARAPGIHIAPHFYNSEEVRDKDAAALAHLAAP